MVSIHSMLWDSHQILNLSQVTISVTDTFKEKLYYVHFTAYTLCLCGNNISATTRQKHYKY